MNSYNTLNWSSFKQQQTSNKKWAILKKSCAWCDKDNLDRNWIKFEHLNRSAIENLTTWFRWSIGLLTLWKRSKNSCSLACIKYQMMYYVWDHWYYYLNKWLCVRLNYTKVISAKMKDLYKTVNNRSWTMLMVYRRLRPRICFYPSIRRHWSHMEKFQNHLHKQLTRCMSITLMTNNY